MAEPITDERLDDIERRWQNHAGSPGPIGATVLQLIAELRAARVEARQYIEDWQAVARQRDEMLAAIERLAPVAARYDGRIFQIAYMPEFVTRFLAKEDVDANNEYPSDTDHRVLAERDELQRRVDATLQMLATKFIWCYERQVILIDKVRAALTGGA